MPKVTDQNLLFFDNGFLRKLTERPSEGEYTKWQSFFTDHINQVPRPFAILFSPFCFLESVGIANIPRPNFDPIRIPRKILSSESDVADFLSSEIQVRLSYAIHFYATCSKISEGQLIAAANIQANKHTALTPAARMFAEDTYLRFKKKADFHDEVCHWLALDALQQFLENPGAGDHADLARLICIADLFRGQNEGFNVPCFRLLRSIWRSVEPEILNPGFKTLLPLKSAADFVDTECIHFALFGFNNGSQSFPVTVYTCDPPESVKSRLTFAKYLTTLFSSDILAKAMERKAIAPPIMEYGRVICCDPTNPQIRELIDVATLPIKIVTPLGALRPFYEGESDPDNKAMDVTSDRVIVCRGVD